MNQRKIWLGIIIIIVLAVVVGVLMRKAKNLPQKNVQPPAQNTETKTQPAAGEKTKDQACLDSGGTVSAASCCGQTQDFPNTCAIGACGCAPASSHQVKTCDCGDGKCFNGNECVDRSGKPVLE